jgi:hypothetical protein
MRTKTLLTAAAALVAGIISSEAQTVYSVNVAGYANVVIPGGGTYSLIANPFDDGNGNQLTNILSSTFANKSQVLTWNPQAGSYNPAIIKAGGSWPTNISLPPGIGFFIKNATTTPVTNVFTGNIVVNSGASGTNALPVSYSLVGSEVPYAGDGTVDTNINLGQSLANKSQLLAWDPVGQAFAPADIKAGGSFPTSFPVGIGQGFFIKNNTATNWIQNLQ